MQVKAISNQDFGLIQRVCFDQWYLQKCHARLRALEVISHPPDIDIFQKLVGELVCFDVSTCHGLLNTFNFFQKHLHQLAACARSFDAVLDFDDLDTSMFQEALTKGTTAGELHILIPDGVAHVVALMTDEQKEWNGFDRWYRTMMDFIVFGPGSEEDPIIVGD